VIGHGAELITASGSPSQAAIVVEVMKELGVVPFFAFARAGWSPWARWGDAASARVT